MALMAPHHEMQVLTDPRDGLAALRNTRRVVSAVVEEGEMRSGRRAPGGEQAKIVKLDAEAYRVMTA